MPIFQTDRRFEVVAWSPGHGGLLLRSRPTEPLPPDAPFDRIEIWFKPAYVACLPVTLHGFTVEEADTDSTTAVARTLGRGLSAWEKVYLVTSADGPGGWVICGSVNGRADTAPFDAPSMFDGWEAREGVRNLFAHGAR